MKAKAVTHWQKIAKQAPLLSAVKRGVMSIRGKMKKCAEFAIFQVAKENIIRAVELSEAIFSEMNEHEEVITSSNVLVKIDNPEEICWHLEWVSAETAKKTTEKWPTFPSTKEFQGMIIKDLYYGHFVNPKKT